MFDFLSRGRPKSTAPAAASAPNAATPPPSAAQREMVRLALHSMLRHKGIPGNWLSCETTPMHIAGQGDAVLVQLKVLKWHDALMHYAPALQQALIEGLTHFDANATASKYHFSWVFAPDCGNPHAQFPEASFWHPSTAGPTIAHPIATAQTTATPIGSTSTAAATKPKFDLPATTADLRNAQDEDDDHGFAATQINDM